MFLYVGNYWIPFPSSEYGGSWVVMAENENQCIDLLKELCYYEEYHELIPGAVEKAKVFQLDVAALESNTKPHVVDNFFT